MAWTAPKTWTNEPIIATDLNAHIRDNLTILKDPASAIYYGDEGSDLSGLTSTSFANVDATAGKFSHSITTNGGPIFVFFRAHMICGTSARVHFEVTLDGSPQGGVDGLYSYTITTTASSQGFVHIIPAPSAGNHTINLQYKMSVGTLTIYRRAGTANADIPCFFAVREMS